MTRLLDVILALVLVEAVALALYHRLTGSGIASAKLIPNLAAGFFLMLGARLAAGGAPAWALPACLLFALFAHLADMAARWRTRPHLSDM